MRNSFRRDHRGIRGACACSLGFDERCLPKGPIKKVTTYKNRAESGVDPSVHVAASADKRSRAEASSLSSEGGAKLGSFRSSATVDAAGGETALFTTEAGTVRGGLSKLDHG